MCVLVCVCWNLAFCSRSRRSELFLYFFSFLSLFFGSSSPLWSLFPLLLWTENSFCLRSGAINNSSHTYTHSCHLFWFLGTGFCTPFLFIIIIILVVCYFFDLICRLKGTPAIVYIAAYRVCRAFDGLVRANYAFFDFAQAIEIIIRRQMLQILSTIARHWSRKLKCLFAS